MVRLGDERLKIPYRIYNSLEPATVIAGTQESVVLACILSRHHNGFERQKNAAKLYSERNEWVVPFILLLVGEYVIEILSDIEKAIPSMDLQMYRKVISENPVLWEVTRQRVGSYWNAYYRRQYPHSENYPGFRVIAALSGKAHDIAL